MGNIYLYVNVGIVVVYFVAIVGAYRRGFLYEGVSLLLTVGSLVIAWLLSPVLAKKWMLLSGEGFTDFLLKAATPYLNIALWFLIILAFFKFISLFFLPILKKATKLPFLGGMNRLLGVFVGALHASFWLVLLSMFLAFPFIPFGKNIREKTWLSPINHYANKALFQISQRINVQELSQEMKQAQIAFSQWLEHQDFLHD